MKFLARVLALSAAMLLAQTHAHAQSGSTRPRRVFPPPASTEPAPDATNNSAGNTPAPSVPATERPTAPARRPATSAPRPAVSNAETGDTTRAFELLRQKQYAEAAREAKRITEQFPKDSEAWKIAGFAELNLKQYAEAVADLERALKLQRDEGSEDPFTVDALGQAYALTEQYDRALPLLVTATTRAGAKPDPNLLFLRGMAEYRTNRAADAEQTFKAVAAANPKDAAALYYLGLIAYEQNRLDAAITALNRATQNDARSILAWRLLTIAYLRRAGTATDEARANADYLSAIRAGEGLTRIRMDADHALLLGQALIGAQQFARAATVLETATAQPEAGGTALFLLGVAHSRNRNYPKAIAALERATAKSPEDANIFRELGYVYEVSKQYAKALAAYERGAALAPADTYFKESIERVRPFAN